MKNELVLVADEVNKLLKMQDANAVAIAGHMWFAERICWQDGDWAAFIDAINMNERQAVEWVRAHNLIAMPLLNELANLREQLRQAKLNA